MDGWFLKLKTVVISWSPETYFPIIILFTKNDNYVFIFNTIT